VFLCAFAPWWLTCKQSTLEKGKDCLKSADILAVIVQLADAVSRIYYYAYHNMKAILLSKSLEPKTHDGILRLLGMHFIKSQI